MFLGFLFTPTEVCYGKYGCFKLQPGANAWRVYLPEKPSVIRTSFEMFTRYGSGFVNDIDEGKLEASKFDISRRTIFVIHGYTCKCLLCGVFSFSFFFSNFDWLVGWLTD